jgi:hypothetical protein
VPDLSKIPQSKSWARASRETKAIISGAFRTVPSDYGMPLGVIKEFGTSPATMRHAFEIIFDIARQDWAGEVQYIEAVLAMMNARNVSENKPVDNARYNKKRIKQGKTTLFDHHVITISMRQKQRMAPRDPSEGEHAEVRRHFVRGHWKVRSSGIFFWRPFIRGKTGFVRKEYKVAM